MGVDQAMSGKSGPVAAMVVEERPAAVYTVVLENQHRVLAHLVGAVKRNFVRLVPGDRVQVELAPHDPTRGKIVAKLSGADPRPSTSGPGR